jgi:hypothetical protein
MMLGMVWALEAARLRMPRIGDIGSPRDANVIARGAKPA